MNLSTTQFPPARKLTRAEVTDLAAREIITKKREARNKQTARLRAARLKWEAAEKSAQSATSPKSKTKG